MERRPSISNAELVRTTLRHIGVRAPAGSPLGRHVFWQCVGFVDDVPRLQKELARLGIDSATTNLPLVCALGPGATRDEDYPVAMEVKRHAIFLPSHPRVSQRHLRRLARGLISWSSRDRTVDETAVSVEPPAVQGGRDG